MSATNAFETSLLTLLFNNTALAEVGNSTGLPGSEAAGAFYVSLHTASPGETGTQTTSEAAYTSYGRVSVTRDSSGWAISGNTADNAAAVTFPQATGGGESETAFGIGAASSGQGTLFLYGALSAELGVSNGITPQFATGDLDVTLD